VISDKACDVLLGTICTTWVIHSFVRKTNMHGMLENKTENLMRKILKYYTTYFYFTAKQHATAGIVV